MLYWSKYIHHIVVLTEIYCRFTINSLSYHTTGWHLLDPLLHFHRQIGMKYTSYLPAYEDGTDNVPKRRHIKLRSRGITQKKAYSIQNTAAVWNQEFYILLSCVLREPLSKSQRRPWFAHLTTVTGVTSVRAIMRRNSKNRWKISRCYKYFTVH